MFLMCLIPSPSNPKASIDVYLQPLIDDLNKLCSGIWTYDVSSKHLRVFGSICYIHVSDQKRHKLEDKTIRGICLGYRTQ